MTAGKMFQDGYGLCLLGPYWYWWDASADEGRKVTTEELREAAAYLTKSAEFNEALDKATEDVAVALDIPKEMLT